MIRSTSGCMERCNSLSAPSSSAARARNCCNARSRARARSAGPIVNPDSTSFQLAAASPGASQGCSTCCVLTMNSSGSHGIATVAVTGRRGC
eukprot:3704407-Alexandrium_andersonii.AAC.1